MVKKRKRKNQNQRQTQSPRAALRSLWGRWARARRQHRPRRRCTAGPNTAGAGPAARAEGRWRAVKGKTVLPGLYLSWSPRSCRRGAPLAGRPRRRPGTAPCPGRRRPPPALPAARWRRGAERAGNGSSSARPQDGGRGRRAGCWRRCWQAGGRLSVGLRVSCALRRRIAGLEQGSAAGRGGKQFPEPARPSHRPHPS